VNFRKIKDMKRRSKHFGGMSEFTSIADTFISSAEVWIKVCNLNFQETNPDFTY
jgi:hypothetical protein